MNTSNDFTSYMLHGKEAVQVLNEALIEDGKTDAEYFISGVKDLDFRITIREFNNKESITTYHKGIYDSLPDSEYAHLDHYFTDKQLEAVLLLVGNEHIFDYRL